MDILKNKLIEIIDKVDFVHVAKDIAPFVEDPLMVKFIKSNGKIRLKENIYKM